LQWAGHVAHIGNGQLRKTLVENYEGKGSLW